MAKRRRINYADVMSTFAAFLALGGVSYAAISLPKNSVAGKHIKKGAVASSDVKNGSLQRTDFKAGLLPSTLNGTDGTEGTSGTDGSDGADGGDGAAGVDGVDGTDGTDGLQGPPGPPGPQGPAGPQGPKGNTGLMGPEGPAGPSGTARAYATIDPASCGGGACVADKSKDIGNVTRVSTGRYCITAFGLSSEFLPAYASVEHSTTASPQSNAFAIVSSSSPECLTNQFLVVTKRMNTESVKNTANATVTVLGGTDTVANNVGFSILIP